VTPPPRIAVFGAHKTGTTAVWTKIRDSVTWEPRLLFEPLTYEPEPEDGVDGVLAKVMLVPPDALDMPEVQYDGFVDFERTVMIRRDPRDWVVSAVLFSLQRHAGIWDDRARLEEILAMLRRKEADPRSVDIVEVFAQVCAHGLGVPLEVGLAAMRKRLEFMLEFAGRLTDPLVLAYEDFVDGRLGALADYLDVEMTADAPIVDAEYRHVPRTCAHGSWRNWFTAKDIEVFRPVVGPYMERWGYEDRWELSPEPRIPVHESSGYVERVATLRRRWHSPAAPVAW
jgi:hypothetical protein